MWRASLGKRLVLLSVALVISFLWSFYRAGPSPTDGYEVAKEGSPDGSLVRRNLARQLRFRYGVDLRDSDLFLVHDHNQWTALSSEVFAFFHSTGVGGNHRDVFRVFAQVSRTGVPTAFSAPINITKTALVDEEIFHIRDASLFYGSRVDDAWVSVRLLDFARGANSDGLNLDTHLADAIAGQGRYGEWGLPYSLDLELTPPGKTLSSIYDADVLTLSVDGTEIVVNLRTGAAKPAGRVSLVTHDAPGGALSQVIDDLLRRPEALGETRMKLFEAMSWNWENWWTQQVHRLLPTPGDMKGLAQMSEPTEPLTLWPPPALPVDGDALMPGEGRWRPHEGFSNEIDPPVLVTFTRNQVARPHERTLLFAFDMRRLGLQFAAGARDGEGGGPLRGTGSVPKHRRPYVIAAFDGGIDFRRSPAGEVERGRVISPPIPGLATVATDTHGNSFFGLWDNPPGPALWFGLRQAAGALIENGTVKPGVVPNWGKEWAIFDDVYAPRSAVGITEAGVLIYAWSNASTARALGASMKLAGAVFAAQLQVGARDAGVEIFGSGIDGDERSPGDPGMRIRDRGWQSTASESFFYVFRAVRMPQTVNSDVANWKTKEGVWRPIQELEGVPVVAESFLTRKTLGSNQEVRLLLMETNRLRPHVIPGLAELKPDNNIRREEMVLPAAPLSWLGIGLRSSQTPFGFVVERKTWRRPQTGVMTLVVDASGGVEVGRFAEGQIPNTLRWSTLIQGPALLDGGVLSDSARGNTGLPAVGAGKTSDGLLLLATSVDGDREAIARAMLQAGVDDGLLLGEVGTVDTGQARFFYREGGRYVMTDDDPRSVSSAQTNPLAGSSLVFTARSPLPSARLAKGFVAPLKDKGSR